MTALALLKTATETELRRFYVAACTGAFLDVRLFIRNIVKKKIDDHFVRAGISGQADVWGYLYRDPYPMPLEIELKNVKTPDTDEQIRWRTYCVTHKVPFLYMRAQKGDRPAQVIADWVTQTDRWLKQLRSNEFGPYKSPPMVLP